MRRPEASGKEGVGRRQTAPWVGAVNADVGRFDRSAANTARRVAGRYGDVLLVRGAARYLVVGAATVVAFPAKGWASQENPDQEIGKECSHQ
jgi:hypothetical protein